MADIRTRVGTIEFPTPVLTGAGPNVRDHQIINKVLGTRIGGIVTKTFSTSPANYPKPAVTKTTCNGLLNCETWSEKGPEDCLSDYEKIQRDSVPVVVSIGYSIEDMQTLGPLVEQRLTPDAIEFSTHYQDQAVEDLVSIASALRQSVNTAVWMKISPGQANLESILEATHDIVDAYVAVNSLGPALDFNIEKGRPSLGSPQGYGWLSGPPLLPLALQTVHRIAAATDKPIVGVGGISTGEDAIKFLMAGASAVQVCSAAILGGTTTYARIADEIEHWLDEHNYASISDIQGMYKRAVMATEG